MKKITIIILLLLAFNSWSQNDKIGLQKNKYNLALSYLQKKQFAKAIDPLLFAYKINPKSEIGKISKNKIDSLKPVIRKNLVDKLTGTWNLIGNHPMWIEKQPKKEKSTDTLMVITNEQISYYVKNKKTKDIRLIKTEKLEFYDGFANNNSVTEMVNSDKELWTFIVDESLKSLRLIHTGNETTLGRNTIHLDNKELYYTKIK